MVLLDDEQHQQWILGDCQPDGVRIVCFYTVKPIIYPWRGHRQTVRDDPMDDSIALLLLIFVGISSLPRCCARPSDDQWEGLDKAQDSFHK